MIRNLFCQTFMTFLVTTSIAPAKSIVQTYEEVTGTQKAPYCCRIDTLSGNRLQITVTGATETIAAQSDDLCTVVQSATFQSHGSSNQTIVRRDGEKLCIDGGKTFVISRAPWYVDMNAVGKALKNEKSHPFWILSDGFSEIDHKNGLSAIPLVAKFKEFDTITLNGTSTPTIRAQVTFPDWRSVFWKSTYWFRQTDGVMIRSESVRGGPGTKKTVVTLIREEVLP